MKVTRNLRLKAMVLGRVQGVFYRAWTKTTAKALGLTGWVRNLTNGAVELVAEGPKEKLEELKKRCEVGPPKANVESIEIQWEEAEDLWEDFLIRH